MSIRTRVLVLSEGQILLIPASGAADLVWRLPGEGLEPHESLSECAEREILEETGIRVRAGKIAFLREWVVPARGLRPVRAGGLPVRPPRQTGA